MIKYIVCRVLRYKSGDEFTGLVHKAEEFDRLILRGCAEEDPKVLEVLSGGSIR